MNQNLMFQIFTFKTTTYFAFGQASKSSLIAEFCRENKYQHIKNPILEAVQNRFANHVIIEGSVELFRALEPLKPDMQAIFVGKEFSEEQIQIRRDYRKIGRCIEVRQMNYQKFRKTMYPNLIFFYGPNQQQNYVCAQALQRQIGYLRVALLPDANSFIRDFKKTINYVINGFFTSKDQITILQQFFDIKVIHFVYNRIDLPEKSQYFDKQFELLSFLKTKSYYIPINGLNDSLKVIDDVSQALSPRLIYGGSNTVQKRSYLDEYLYRNQENALILSISQIQSINKRKNLKLAETPYHRALVLNEILYRDFNIKTAVILDFPFLIHDVVNFQSANRKFEKFIDLQSANNNHFSKEFNTQMYFLTNQKRVVPNLTVPLEDYINSKTKYWLINGPAGCGKTTVAKILVAQYGFKLIQYEPYIASVKQKLMTPEDGQQLPFRKILAHFKSILTQNADQTYVIDGLPFDNKQLEEWIRVIGAPSVINLQVGENQSIKRLRKKNQADVNAQINQEQLNKAKESLAKAQGWLEKVRKWSSVAQVHEINFGQPLMLSQKLIHKIFRKNVYLVQSHNGLAFQNIALKYNVGFVNLYMTPLRESLSVVRSIPNRDVILCYYKQTEQQLISEDLYWIEKNIGNIRYLAIWEPEAVQLNREKIQLQRPHVEEKPKVEGAEGEQKPPEEQNAAKKDVFDIYSFEWTKPLNPSNLSQWFMKSKKNVSKVQSQSGKQLFENWLTVTNSLNGSDDAAVYQTFKQ